MNLKLIPLSLLPLTLALPTFPSQNADLTTRQTTTLSSTPSTWNSGATTTYPIHASCNSTETLQLTRAFDEALKLASHARDHILRWGNESDIYVKYFGNSSTAEPAGRFDRVVNADKSGVLFRCDDIDNKCYQDGWAGHWRGPLSPDQTVICPLSFLTRQSLESLCSRGYTIAYGKENFYFGADLLHRLWHTSKISEGVVHHYADGAEEILDLAVQRPDEAVRNSVGLSRFALEVWAYDFAVPGVGCPGTVVTATATATTTTAATAAETSGLVVSTTVAVPSTTVSSAAQECHTHGDGSVHCA